MFVKLNTGVYHCPEFSLKPGESIEVSPKKGKQLLADFGDQFSELSEKEFEAEQKPKPAKDKTANK
jgi:hypothetical protein